MLVSLVENKLEAVECKKSDSPTITMQKQTSDLIADSFNQNIHVPRPNSDQLKKCWESLKARAKTRAASYRRWDSATILDYEPNL